MAKDLLVEVGLEEIPAHLVTPTAAQLEKKVTAFFDSHSLSFQSIEMFSTPRRLAFRVNQLAEKQPDVSEKVKGPAKKIACDADGNWSKAAEGFVRGQGGSTEDIFFEEVKGVEYVFINKFTPGKDTVTLLPELSDVIMHLTFPISMRWADYDFSYIRPIHWLVALWDEEIVPMTILDVTASNESRGHRFLGGKVVVSSPHTYEQNLKDEWVIVDAEERKQMIVSQIAAFSRKNNWVIELDDSLLEEVTNLVEYPTAFIGSFSDSYLSIPDEVLVTSMKEHQRYFDVRDASGQLLPYFISVRNGDDRHLENVIKGNEKVLVARLEDAAFFYEEDQQLTIDACVEKLKTVTFHEKIGTMYEKMQRVGAIAQMIARKEGLNSEELADLERASAIYKFDLVTNMVGEFPELQGIMGEKYALLQSEKPTVAQAIREHYLPSSSDSALPESNIGAVLAVADKMDTLMTFFAVGLEPTGSNDPYALRRQTYGIIRIINDKQWRFPVARVESDVKQLINQDVDLFGLHLSDNDTAVQNFFKNRMKQWFSSQSVRHDIIEAVTESSQDDLYQMMKASEILKNNANASDFKSSIEALTRVINLALKEEELLFNREGEIEIDSSLFENESEQALYDAVEDLENHFSDKTLKETYDALKNLRPLIEDYFDNTMVMVDDIAVRRNRLKQLAKITRMALSFASLDRLIVK